MKIALILTSNDAEKNWNALRLANLSLIKGDVVGIFLLGEGVEYEKNSSEKFDIKTQINTYLQSENASILACGTCMKSRNQETSEACPSSGLEELYDLVSAYDKVLSF